MTSRSLARVLALSSTLAVFGWAFAGGCGGHPLTTPHPSGGAGTGSAGSSASGEAGTSATGIGTGAAGTSATGVGGTTGSGAAGSGGSPVSATCMAAKTNYDGLRAKLAEFYGASSCSSNADCTAVFEPGNCGPECPDVALPTSAQLEFVSNLMSDAAVCDGVCPPRQRHSCPANPAICENGKCALAGIIGAGGSTGTSGSAGVGGSAGASGGTGQGGTGGASACGPCAQPLCKDGFMSVVDPAISCCPICRPINCATVACLQPPCPSGSHLEIPTGMCCPVCVMGVSQACNQAETQYATDRQAYLEKYNSIPCKVDTECRLVFESNSCVSNCGEALPVVTAGNFETNIARDAMACNAACPPGPMPSCLQLVAVCSNGSCTAVPRGGLGLN